MEKSMSPSKVYENRKTRQTVTVEEITNGFIVTICEYEEGGEYEEKKVYYTNNPFEQTPLWDEFS